MIKRELYMSRICPFIGNELIKVMTGTAAAEDTITREIGVYETIRDSFTKYVVSLDEFDMSRNGIKHRNIRDFLMETEWN